MRENAGNQWSETKNQFLVNVGKYIFFERRDPHLSENKYFPRLLYNRFLVTVHRFPAFFRISRCQLEHNLQHRTHIWSVNTAFKGDSSNKSCSETALMNYGIKYCEIFPPQLITVYEGSLDQLGAISFSILTSYTWHGYVDTCFIDIIIIGLSSKIT